VECVGVLLSGAGCKELGARLLRCSMWPGHLTQHTGERVDSTAGQALNAPAAADRSAKLTGQSTVFPPVGCPQHGGGDCLGEQCV